MNNLSLPAIHLRLYTASILFLLVCAIWGFLNYSRNKGVDSNYAGTLAIGEILLIIEGIVGLVMFLSGISPGRPVIHILYGVVSVVAIPAVFVFTQGRTETKREAMLYGLITLFLCIMIAVRAQTTGSPATALQNWFPLL